jgi:hypothetical protein
MGEIMQPSNNIINSIHATILRIFDRNSWILEKEWITNKSILIPESKIRGFYKRKRWKHPRTGYRWESDWM